MIKPLRLGLGAAAIACVVGHGCVHKVPQNVDTTAKGTELVILGDSRDLRKRSDDKPKSSPDKPPILLLLIDGMNRGLLYDMLRAGELPQLASLLGPGAGKLDHAHLDETLVATLPSSTMVAWTTALTGVGPATHGISGNEFFIRDKRQFAAPVPVTFSDTRPVIECFTKDYADNLRMAPSAYERMREKDPNVLIWVAMHQFHPGADRLLMTKRSVVAKAMEAFLEDTLDKMLNQKESREVYEKLDSAVMDVVVSELDKDPLPDVLTVYMSGTDSFAHVADDGPDKARRAYMKEVLEPQFGRLYKKLRERGGLEERFVVLTADHGHTEILKDDAHALAMKGKDDPPMVLKKAGFRVRPFKLEVDSDDDFNAVLAYQGAMAFVYVANRTSCPKEDMACDWTQTPCFEEDVLPLADAFYKNNIDGSYVPEMKGTLDMVLTRRPMHHEEADLPFEVYVGDHKLMPIDKYLEQNPHPTYVDLDARMRDLGVGPHGERAGDVILIAHNGDRDRPEDRYYFASVYRSWHGSPSKNDSEIPLIVAHPKKSSGELRAMTQRMLGEHPRQQKVTDLLLDLRSSSAR
jgi:hypothetical protein